MKQMTHNIENNQRGMVSFLVCLIMMIVITLVVLGFSQVSRNETAQTLNRQLSTEAFYAADSGINNATAIITADVNGTPARTPVSQSGSCGGATDPYNKNAQLDSTYITYSCVTVDTTPTSLNYDVPAEGSAVFPVDVGVGNQLNSITFSWNNGEDDYTKCPTAADSGTFSVSSIGTTCDASVLEVNLISEANSQTIAGEEDDSYSIYLYPTKNAGPSLTTFANGNIYVAPCAANSTCSATVSGFPASQGYYLRVTSLYGSSYLKVTANSDAPLSNAEADVDSTGRAQNVLQRLSAEVSLTPGLSGQTPLYAVQTGDSLCKLISGYPPGEYAAVGSAGVGTLSYGATTIDAGTPGCSLN
jgi:Tfp pilus assembly protein PilX